MTTLASGTGKGPDEKKKTLLKRKFTKMMSALYKEEGASLRVEILQEPEVMGFIDTHAAILDSAFEQAEMSDTMRQRLQESDWMFSGMKTFHELNEAFPSLIREDGSRKPFKEFLKDVQTVDKTYNGRYLKAEYNFANASADMAARWERFEDSDRYLLQYRTQNDGAVRPEHAALHGVTLPASDSFWDTYFPPNGWNCRCTVVQVLRDKYPETDHNEAMRLGREAMTRDTKGMFSFNPGKQGKVFPAYNPYTISRCATCDKAKLNLGADITQNELCYGCAKILDICEMLRVNKYPTDDDKRVSKEKTEAFRKSIPSGNPLVISLENVEHLSQVTISRANVKNWRSHPHRYYIAKNNAIVDLPKLFKRAEYEGWATDDTIEINGAIQPKHPGTKQWLYYKVRIIDDESLICVQERTDGTMVPYCVDEYDTWKDRTIRREAPPE